MSAIGDYIVQERTRRGMTQRTLADTAGVSRSYLCDIERGRAHMPSAATIARLGAVLGPGVLGVGTKPHIHCRHWAIQWADGSQQAIQCRDCGEIILTLPAQIAA